LNVLDRSRTEGGEVSQDNRFQIGAVDLESIVLRYLAAFGPASVQDIQTWCGLTRLSGIVNGLRDRLVVYRNETGRELYDLPDQVLPDPEMRVPVRYLPEWDTILLSYADKSRILPSEYSRLIFTTNGIIRATVLIDGYVAGIWRASRAGNSATLVIDALKRFDRPTTEDAISEGMRLLKFLEPEATSQDVKIVQQ